MPGASQRPALTIVLPAYNEAARIGPALDELFAYLRARETSADGTQAIRIDDCEVLVVDDGSTDDTARLVAARPETKRRTDGERPQLRLQRERHGGKGWAVRAGMLAAQGELVVFADADLATPPDQLPILLAALADHDVALGSRVQPDGTDRRASQPGYRRALGHLFHALAATWVTGSVPDTQCGFKGFTRAAAQDVFARQRVRSIAFDAELIYLARRRGYRIAIVPVHWSDKRGSRMRPSPALAARVAWDLFRIPLMHRGIRRRA